MTEPITSFDFAARTRLVFEAGGVARLGDLAVELGDEDRRVERVLLVTDPGVAAAGLADRAAASLRGAGLDVASFQEATENPTAADVADCAAFATDAFGDAGPDVIVGFGGGSAIDTAKGANFILTNGGRMQDYLGYAKAPRPFRPLIAVPTTAGTGSECQSYALISDEASHRKMACGDPKAAAKIALLDPELTRSMPRHVTAAAGIDAISHAVETAVTTKRNAFSSLFATEAFRLMHTAFERVLAEPNDLDARGAMLLGAAYAGTAIELSMLGAAHSAANPLTARFGVTHGPAVSVMLPHVVRFNGELPEPRARYRDLMVSVGAVSREDTPEVDDFMLADRLLAMARAAGLPVSIAEYGIDASAIPDLARDAASQWTAQFNPRPIARSDFEALYRDALETPLGA